MMGEKRSVALVHTSCLVVRSSQQENFWDVAHSSSLVIVLVE